MSHPTITSGKDLADHDGEEVTVTGTYVVHDLGGHRLKVPDGDGGYRSVRRIALVRLQDDRHVELGARPDEELDDLEGQAVSASGKLYFPSDGGPENAARRRRQPTLATVRVARSRSG